MLAWSDVAKEVGLQNGFPVLILAQGHNRIVSFPFIQMSLIQTFLGSFVFVFA